MKIIDLSETNGFKVQLCIEDQACPRRFRGYGKGEFSKWANFDDFLKNAIVLEEVAGGIDEAVTEAVAERVAMGTTTFEYSYSLEHDRWVGRSFDTAETTRFYTLDFDIIFRDRQCHVLIRDIYPDADSSASDAARNTSSAAA